MKYKIPVGACPVKLISVQQSVEYDDYALAAAVSTRQTNQATPINNKVCVLRICDH